MKLRFSQTLTSCIIFMAIAATICFSETSGDYISDEKWVKDELDPRMSRWQSGNINELLGWTDEVLNNYPNLLKLHLLKGHILFYRLAKIEDAVYHYNRVKNDATILENSRNNSSQKKEIDNLQYQANRALNQIKYGYGDLRFKIRGKRISKFCYIRNMKVIISWDEQVNESAEEHQRLRFKMLDETLSSGKMKFMFADFDSVDNRIYFKIPYFPLIESGIFEPYSMIINNEKRYHFNFDNQSNSIIELDWNTAWELVEAVPDNYVKIEYDHSLNVAPVMNRAKFNYDKILSVPEENPDIINIYLPVESGQSLDVEVTYSPQQQKLEKAILIINRSIIISSFLLMFIVVR